MKTYKETLDLMNDFANGVVQLNKMSDSDLSNILVALEEQIKIKEDGFSDHLLNMGYTKGYLAGIDGLAEKISVYGTFDYHGNTINVLEIAEQMKKGK